MQTVSKKKKLAKHVYNLDNNRFHNFCLYVQHRAGTFLGLQNLLS